MSASATRRSSFREPFLDGNVVDPLCVCSEPDDRFGDEASRERAYVSRLTREDFEEIYALRLGIEGLAARLGAPRVDADGLAAMRSMLERLRAHATRGEVDEYLALRWEFHATCYRASGRTRLVNEVEHLYRRSERYNRLVLATPDRFRESVDRYREFLVACESLDGDAAERVIHQAMRWAVNRVAPTLPAERELATVGSV